MEFITDVTCYIDEADFKDSGRFLEIIQAYSPKKQGSRYMVTGTFKKVEQLFLELQNEHTSAVKPVDVSAFIMAYVEEKCANELSRIRENSFVIETDPELSTVNLSTTVQVTLRPRHASITPVHADLARQRFITFYQRTASDLQVTSVPVSRCKDLEKRFPQLLFKPSRDNCDVIGPYVHIAKLKELLLPNTRSSSRSPVTRGPVSRAPPERAGSRSSDPSPAHSRDGENESCPICMEPIATAEKETLQCKHSFCKDCLQRAFDYKPVCPTCGQLYGTLTGTQPDGGSMKVTRVKSSLPGYGKYGTIKIDYYIPSGIQKEEHPHPGQPYEGVSRTAYLPDSSEGRRILRLLQRAFEQRLIFTVGRSTTSGRNNAVTWNDIHHKTSTHGGPTHYGYPDPDYLSRVRDELKVKGIQ